jgi:hypothetical protein
LLSSQIIRVMDWNAVNLYNTASLIDRKWTHSLYRILLLYINRSSLSSTNKEKRDVLIVLCSVTFIFSFVYQNNESMIYYLSTIKEACLFFFSLFLSFILLWFIKNVLVDSQPRLEQIAQTMLRWIPLKICTDSYTYFY